MKEEDVRTLVNYRIEEAKTALDDARYLNEGMRSTQSIVNRIYYAMFYAVMALLQKTGKVPSKHTGVISLFDTEFVLKGTFPKDMSMSFHRAFELRHVSDYKVAKPISPETVNELLEESEVFVETIRAYLKC